MRSRTWREPRGYNEKHDTRKTSTTFDLSIQRCYSLFTGDSSQITDVFHDRDLWFNQQNEAGNQQLVYVMPSQNTLPQSPLIGFSDVYSVATIDSGFSGDHSTYIQAVN